MRVVYKSFLAGFAASTVLIFVSAASAADLPKSSACTVMGIVSGGAGTDRVTLTEDPNSADFNWLDGFGEGALGWRCGNWNFQADAALHNFTGTDTPSAETGHFRDRQTHIGGAIFARVPDVAAVGISASVISDAARLDVESPLGDFSLSGSGNIFRFGAFGEYYVSDQLTIGGSAHYLKGGVPVPLFPPNDEVSGLEVSALAKYYISENFVLTARADLFNGHLDLKGLGVSVAKLTGAAASLEGEYGLPNSNFSLFVGGRLAQRDFAITGYPTAELSDMQLYTGLKFSFGGGTASLAERDRSGTYDNTSVFAEKLPNISDSLVRGESFFGP